MRKILLTFLLGLLFLPATWAQEQGSSFAPKAGDMQTNLLLGKGMFYAGTNYSLYIPKYQATTHLSLTSAPNILLSIADPNYNDIANMIGAEFKYFVTDNIAVSFVGAGYISSTPSTDGVEGVPAAKIPSYEPIEAELGSRVVASIGAQYFFKVKNERIHPYAGIEGTFQYASLSADQAFDPADPADVGYGTRTGRAIGWAPSITAGIEYNILSGLSIGFEVKPVSCYFSQVDLYAQPGLDALTGCNTEFSFLAQPRFKIGFRF